MNSLASTRLSRLQSICATNAWGPSEVARQMGSGTASYWSDLLRGKKSFGEKLARKIELSFGLESGHLDEDTDEPTPTKLLSPRAKKIAVALDALPSGSRRETIIEMIEKLIDISPHNSALGVGGSRR